MKKIAFVLIFAFLIGLFLFPGCATGPAFRKVDSIPDNMGLVYIYRPGGFVGSAVSYTVKASGVPVVSLTNGGYYPYFSKPGEIEFSAKTESTSSITLDVKPGQTYYLKGTIGVGILVGRPHLTLAPSDIGEREIAGCKLLQEPKKE